jgi:hypothetical protein
MSWVEVRDVRYIRAVQKHFDRRRYVAVGWDKVHHRPTATDIRTMKDVRVPKRILSIFENGIWEYHHGT